MVKVAELNRKEDNDELYSEADFLVDEKAKTATLTPSGVKKAEEYFKVENLLDSENITLQHHINLSLIHISIMNYSHEVESMCTVQKGPNHGPAPIPEEGRWVKAYDIKDISGLSHGVGWRAPQQGACKLTLNVKDGIVEEALVETIGCSGMTHSAAMAAEILPGKTLLECLNTDLVCDAINVAMRELFQQLVYGRSQTAFSEDGLPVGAGPVSYTHLIKRTFGKRGNCR